jgi:apolipoprotein D and lipocalin family protein
MKFFYLFLFLLPFISGNLFFLNLIKKFNLLLKPIRTEKNIDINYYTGKWYQIATSPSTKLFGTGTNYSDVTANYECIDNCYNISVYNKGINNEGNLVSIKGYSYTKKNPTKRKLKFYNLPFIGNYWIVKLGPVINNKYEYAIISGPLSQFVGTRFSLYVLCRNINEFKEKYENEVKEWCIDNGFSLPWNKYIETKHK